MRRKTKTRKDVPDSLFKDWTPDKIIDWQIRMYRANAAANFIPLSRESPDERIKRIKLYNETHDQWGNYIKPTKEEMNAKGTS